MSTFRGAEAEGVEMSGGIWGGGGNAGFIYG
jgi:hypothetical protein